MKHETKDERRNEIVAVTSNTKTYERETVTFIVRANFNTISQISSTHAILVAKKRTNSGRDFEYTPTTDYPMLCPLLFSSLPVPDRDVHIFTSRHKLEVYRIWKISSMVYRFIVDFDNFLFFYSSE